MRTIEKTWGREEIYVESPYCIKKLIYAHIDVASSLHYHQRKHETFTVLEGLFELQTQRPLKGTRGKIVHKQYLSAGEIVEIPPETQHQLRWLGQSDIGVILECSTADAPDDCVRITPSEIPTRVA